MKRLLWFLSIPVIILLLVLVYKPPFDLQKAVDRLGPEGGVVTIPEGIHVIKKPVIINKDNVVIRGASPVSTVLTNDVPDDQLFIVSGSSTFTTQVVSDILPGGGLTNMNPQVEVENAGQLVEGDVILIENNNAVPKKLEFNKIKEMNGNILTLEDKVLESYTAAQSSTITKVSLVKNVTIKNVTIRSSQPDRENFGILAKYTSFLTVRNIIFENIAKNALLIQYSQSPRVQNSIFRDNGRKDKGDFGIGIQESVSAMVSKNQMFSSGAIYLRNNIHSVVSSNYSDGTLPTNGDGISAVGGIGNRYENNTILRANCYGIWIHSGAERNVIVNNTFQAGVTSGIYVTDAYNNEIINNTLTNNSSNGILLDLMAENNHIEGNRLTGNDARGVTANKQINIIGSNISINNKYPDYLYNTADAEK
ncbi:right-handed parallel beta-helix repeat-containing protein [Paenibacillus alginolyticus]|uniref:Right-handed parallel beta-helix repeat-containing protein n=1 Tax=Paenibacillus alginolyticus TaxID=59839 RepID=A0ABT4G8V2_9BACL|nr:right-handed parallel beta-helix repeat-containing protein [Paenibacillus alginolyticus]MCY9692575.1 right-handed parallel beta-helix repeat-containing protein [Paenibacillus alginolyticus]MEC0143781.1 right-handed parallel beta-helix repeat-containing protein [Paenibacillus alginolyticus]